MSYKRDPNYKVPEGFLPVLWGDDRGENPLPVVGLCRLKGAGPYGRDLQFFIGEPAEVIPALPLKAKGELWHKGWDIPTQWAIDSLERCWKDGAHGGCLYPIDSKELLTDAESQEDRNYFRGLLGLELEEPEWMATAKAAGWSSADGFRQSVKLLLQLDKLEEEGRSQGTKEADDIRDQMDDHWYKMTDEEQELVEELSAALRSEEIRKDLVKEVVWRLSTTWFE